MATQERSNRVKELISNFLHSECGQDRKIEDACEDGKPVVENAESLPSQPRNKEAFIKRVESFSTLTWYAKPAQASPLICARYGWLNTGTDFLQCVSCKAVLAGQLPKNADTETYRESCKKLEESIKTSHKSLCPWLHNPSPDAFTEVPLHDYAKVVASYRERFTSIQQLQDKLPLLSNEEVAVDSVDFSKLIKVGTGSNADIEEGNENKIMTISALLAVTGWSCSSTAKEILQCSYCQRQAGLWNFVQLTQRPDSPISSYSDPVNESETNGDNMPPCKKRKKTKNKFCPVTEHKTWCPWVTKDNPDEPANMEDKLESAWRQLLAKLTSQKSGSSPYTLRQSLQESPHEGLRSVRKILKDWTSPVRKGN